MKCICFSDSHGRGEFIEKALRIHPDAEVIFFLGDGLKDIDKLAYDRTKMVIAVQGNCDYLPLFGDSIVKKTDSITLMGYRIFLTHGDLYGAKYGLDGLKKLAEDNRADLVLFGHTHDPLEKYIPTDDGGYYLFNPGSIAGKNAVPPSYGIINLTDKGILLSHGVI